MTSITVVVELPSQFLAELAKAIAERLAEAELRNQVSPVWLYGARAAAKHLGWPVGRVYKVLHRLPHRRDGSALIFSTVELDEYLDGLYEGPSELNPIQRGRSSGVPRLGEPS